MCVQQLAGLPCIAFFCLNCDGSHPMKRRIFLHSDAECLQTGKIRVWAWECRPLVCTLIWLFSDCHGQRELWNLTEDIPNHLAQLALGTPKRSVKWCILHFWTVLCAGVVISSRSSHCFYSDVVPKLYNVMEKPYPVAWFTSFNAT